MITWICSYPRSGSAWTRQTLEQRFEQPVNRAEAGLEYVQQLQHHLGFVRTTEDDVAVGLSSANGRSVWILKATALVLKDLTFRQQIADDERHFYVKTHRPPHASYDQGQRVFFMVRHPMAALTSYQRFLKHLRGREVSLDALIAGNAGHMDFVVYTEEYLALCDSDPRHLVQRYEDKHVHYDAAIERMAQFVGRTPIEAREARPESYAIYGKALRQVARAKMSSWIGSIPPQTLDKFESKFAPLLSRLGYRMPTPADYELAANGGDPALVVRHWI